MYVCMYVCMMRFVESESAALQVVVLNLDCSCNGMEKRSFGNELSI